ncbi:MAG TPA: Holliday junction resolvase RuvX [Gammaproteobacteria bacterium]|nr:Holliday junction resolvase RuvX [Gammaproteobacteria bacterium]
MLEAAARAAARNPDIILAFDFGRRRIGVAAGNLVTRTASPLKTLETAGSLPWKEIDALVADFEPGALVVGMPLPPAQRRHPARAQTSPEARASAEPSAIEERVRGFVAALEARYGLTVATVDESLTSREAESEIREARRCGVLGRRAGKGGIDRRAACLIAEQWMSGEPRSRAPR